MASVHTLKSVLSSLNGETKRYSTKLELLKGIKKAVENEIAKAMNDEVEAISRKVEDTENQELKKLSAAMCHVCLSRKPTIKQLGYELSSIDVTSVPKNKKEEDLLRKILGYLSVSNYVFSYTHYDECSNGFYFRRS